MAAAQSGLDIELAADESVFVIGEEVGLYGGSYRNHWRGSTRTTASAPNQVGVMSPSHRR